METLWIMLKNVIVFVLLAVPGYLLVKTKLLKERDSAVLSKLLSWVGIPFLVISTTMDITFTEEFTKNILLCFIFGTIFTVATFFLSAFLVRKNDEKKKAGMQRFCMISSNNGFLGIPLAQAVFGNSPVVTYVIIFNILTNIFMFTLGVYLVAGDKNAINLKKALLSPVILSFLLGVVFNLIGVPDFLPEATSYANYLKGIVTPLSMIILGIKMAGVDFKKLFANKTTYLVSAVKLLAVPVLGVILVWLLTLIQLFNADMVLAFFVAFAMPTAGTSSILSDEYDGDTEGAVAYILSSTLLSVATIPILYWLVCMIV